MKDWEYRTLKAKDQPGGPKKKKPPIEAQVMKEVGFKLKTMA